MQALLKAVEDAQRALQPVTAAPAPRLRAGARFVIRGMGLIGIARMLAAWIGTLWLSQHGLLAVLPLFLILVLGVVLLVAVPDLALWLPEMMARMRS